jgi:rhodanese-related sulfurtransferase
MAKRVSPKEAQALMAQGYTYVDVRSTPEFERAHPAGAVCVPIAEATPNGMQPNPQFLDQVAARFAKDAQLIVGCEAGGRSARAAAVLEQNGFSNIIDQRAGFGGARGGGGQIVEKGWRDEGLPVATGSST